MTYNPEAAKQYRTTEPVDRIGDRKRKFAKLNAFVTSRHGWIVSIPGEVEVEIQCLPSSDLPAELKGLGYELTDAGSTERILPVAIVEHVEITPGSSTVRTVSHAGITRVTRWVFSLD